MGVVGDVNIKEFSSDSSLHWSTCVNGINNFTCMDLKEGCAKSTFLMAVLIVNEGMCTDVGVTL